MSITSPFLASCRRLVALSMRMIEPLISGVFHKTRSLYRRSNPNPLIEYPSLTLSVHRLNLENLFLYHNSQINNFVSVLILGTLDVLGLLVDLLLGDGVSFLYEIFLMIRDVSTSPRQHSRHRIRSRTLTTSLRGSPVSRTCSTTM